VKILILYLFISISGCTTQNVKISDFPTYDPGPLNPPIEIKESQSLPQKTGSPIALTKGQQVPYTGILLDSYLLSKYKLILSERDLLRVMIQVERDARKQVQTYYNGVLTDALKRAERNWWERNAGLIGLFLGSVGVTVLAIGLSFGLNNN